MSHYVKAIRSALHQQGLMEGRRFNGTAIYIPPDHTPKAAIHYTTTPKEKR